MKNKRQETIIKLISEKSIVTQDELQDELLNAGFNVTQSTVSRDLKQLRVLKVLDENGNYKYAAPNNSDNGSITYATAYYYDVFKRCVRSVKYAINDVVVKCYSGMASSVAVVIDQMFEDYIVGSLAGDDTVLIITSNEEAAKELSEKLDLLKQ